VTRKSRFGNLGDVAPAEMPDVEPAATPTVPERISPPDNLRRSGKRDSLGVRVKPALKERLDQLVLDLRKNDWAITHHDIVEHLLEQLDDPEFVNAMLISWSKTK